MKGSNWEWFGRLAVLLVEQFLQGRNTAFIKKAPGISGGLYDKKLIDY